MPDSSGKARDSSRQAKSRESGGHARPAGSGSKLAFLASTAKKCHHCGKVSFEIVESAGQAVCNECARRSSVRRSAAQVPAGKLWAAAAGLLALMAVCGFFFPGPVLFAVIGLALLALLGAVFAQDLRLRTRCLLALGAVAVMLPSGWGLLQVRAASQQAARATACQKVLDEISALLKRDDLVPAQVRVAEAQGQWRELFGDVPDELAHWSAAADKLINDWFFANYKVISPAERTALFKLFKQLGVKTSAGLRRIQGFSLSGVNAKIMVAPTFEPPKATKSSLKLWERFDPVAEDAKNVARAVFGILSKVDSLELTMGTAADEASARQVFALRRADLPRLDSISR